jgi:hypothetical protein
MKIAVPRDHTHAGVHYKAGMRVDLPEADIAWLLSAERTTRGALLTEVAPEPPPEPEPEPQIEVEAE